MVFATSRQNMRPKSMRRLILLTVTIAGLAAAGSFAARAVEAAQRTDQAATLEAVPATATPRGPSVITQPSTFGVGFLTFAAFGFVYWRRRQYLAATAAL